VQRDDDGLIDRLARDGIAYVAYFPLGGFTPLQSSALSDVAARLRATQSSNSLNVHTIPPGGTFARRGAELREFILNQRGIYGPDTAIAALLKRW
jgi:hypothetical protein